MDSNVQDLITTVLLKLIEKGHLGESTNGYILNCDEAINSIESDVSSKLVKLKTDIAKGNQQLNKGSIEKFIKSKIKYFFFQYPKDEDCKLSRILSKEEVETITRFDDRTIVKLFYGFVEVSSSLQVVPYDKNPQNSTLDVLALYVGYLGFRGFQKSISIDNYSKPETKKEFKNSVFDKTIINEESIKKSEKVSINPIPLEITGILDDIKELTKVVKIQPKTTKEKNLTVEIELNKVEWKLSNILSNKILWVVVALFFFGIAYWGMSILNQKGTSNELIEIVLCEFEGDKNNVIRNDIANSIIEKSSDDVNIKVRLHNSPIRINDGISIAHNEARELSKEYSNAIVIIWGSIRKSTNTDLIKYHIRMTIVKKPAPFFNDEHNLNSIIKSELDLPKEIISSPILLAHYAVGLRFALEDNYHLALKNLNKISINEIEDSLQKSEFLALKANCIYLQENESEPNKKNSQLILQTCNEALKFNSKSSWAYIIRSLYWISMNNSNEALNDINVAYLIDTNSFPALELHGTINLFVKDYESALIDFNKLIQRDPEYIHGFFQKGIIYKKLDSLEKAISTFKYIISKQDKNINAHIELGNIYLSLGKHQDALNSYQKALELDPVNINALYGIANVYDDGSNNYETSQTNYKRVLDLDPQNLPALFSLGLISLKKGEYEKSISYIKKVNNMDTTVFAANYFLGKVYLLEKKYDSALFYLIKALRIDSSFHPAWHQLGKFYSNKKDNKFALKCFLKALSIDTTDFKLWIDIGVVYSLQNNNVDAIHAYEKVLELSDDEKLEPLIRSAIGLCYFSLTDYKTASKYFEAVLKSEYILNKNIIYADLSICYLAIGNVEKVKQFAELSIMENNLDRGNMLLGHAHILLNQFEKATDYYLLSLENYNFSKTYHDKFFDDYVLFMDKYMDTLNYSFIEINNKTAEKFLAKYGDSQKHFP